MSRATITLTVTGASAEAIEALLTHGTIAESFGAIGADLIAFEVEESPGATTTPCPKCGGTTHQCASGDEGCMHCDTCTWSGRVMV